MSVSMAPGDPAHETAAAAGPQMYGRYKLVARIGIGGMAEVFRAVVNGPEGWERELVVKRILPQLSGNPQFQRMFVREAKISALLSHPNIVQIYEFGQAAGMYFIAMESVQGVTLREALNKLKREQRAMPFMVAADIARQMCAGLDYAHTLRAPDGRRLDIVHQDISPTNVMLAYNGTVKILDFGIARAASFSDEAPQTGLVKGKVSYLAPEQVYGQPFDHRADVFALGTVLHEMLTGVRLFAAKNDMGRMKQLLAQPIPPPSAINAAIPHELDAIVMRALELDPAARYPSTAIMAGDIERALIAARYSSRDLSKLLHGLFLPPEEPLVVVDGHPHAVPHPRAAEDSAEANPFTARLRPVRGVVRAPGEPELTRLVRFRWRATAALTLGAVVLGVVVGLGVVGWRRYGTLLLDAPARAAAAVSPTRAAER